MRDEPRAGCSRILHSDQLQVAIDENPTCTTRELSKTQPLTDLAGKVSKAGTWAPSPPPPLPPPKHYLSEINKQQYLTACCLSLRSRELQALFLDRIITDSDEKSLQNRLMGQRLASREEIEMKKLVSFFESKLAKFDEGGIGELMARWEDVMNKNGDYVEH
ncbi:hypothetical protein ACTXT7_001860 [Hymenolepis weldensis]